MAEQFLTLMADLDEEAQKRMSGWYDILKKAGFNGIQTPGLPYHISLTTFPLEQEQKAAELIKRAACEFAPVQVYISHIGIFAPGKVLFAGPERNAALTGRRHGLFRRGRGAVPLLGRSGLLPAACFPPPDNRHSHRFIFVVYCYIIITAVFSKERGERKKQAFCRSLFRLPETGV